MLEVYEVYEVDHANKRIEVRILKVPPCAFENLMRVHVTYTGLLLSDKGGGSGNKRGKDGELHFYYLWSNNLNAEYAMNNRNNKQFVRDDAYNLPQFSNFSSNKITDVAFPHFSSPVKSSITTSAIPSAFFILCLLCSLVVIRP